MRPGVESFCSNGKANVMWKCVFYCCSIFFLSCQKPLLNQLSRTLTFVLINLSKSIKISSYFVSGMHCFHFGCTPRSYVAFVQICFASQISLVFSEIRHAVIGCSAVGFAVSVTNCIVILFVRSVVLSYCPLRFIIIVVNTFSCTKFACCSC